MANIVPVIFALLAYVGWAVGDTLGIRVFRKNNASVIAVLSGFYRMLIWLLLIPFFWYQVAQITLLPLVFNLLAGLTSGFGYYFFGKAAKETNPSLVAAISGGWGVGAIILSLLFFGEQLTFELWLAVALVFVGLYLATFKTGVFRNKQIFVDKGLGYALLAFLFWGLCGAFLKIPASSYGFYWTSVIMLLPYLSIVLLEVKNIKVKQLIRVADFKYFLLMVVFIVLADLGFNGSFAFGGNVAIAGTIAGSYVTLTTLLTRLVYKEKVNRRQAIGIIISLLGIVLASYFTAIS